MNTEGLSRKFNWVSSLDKSNAEALIQLQKRMLVYYSNYISYYKEVDSTANHWLNDSLLFFQKTL